MKEETESTSIFTFDDITKEDVMKELKDLGNSKASQENDFPTKIIKENADIHSHFTYQSFNNMTDVCILLTSLTNITPVFKKGPKSSKENYRPASILPNMWCVARFGSICII